ncbi:hypothetical protein [Actinomadura rubrisoli]|uniref:Uncharacterized protein n=1 Tax=Actinomadura rubrisoli TaxID=2530368 RepID=A0A4R5AAH3_9ACTN|nr:hypothetical protein [Actinomadura rubrisoli]TDD66752.1 hypothetical protein E1298_40090 [Actinomadura rubrisoli]
MRITPTRRAALVAVAATGLAGLGTAAAAAPDRHPSAVRAVTTDEAKAFTACMRTHGMPDFPGLTVSGDGRLNLNGKANVLSEPYQKAARACARLLPKGSALPPAPEPPTVSPPAVPSSGDIRPPKPTPPSMPG